MNRIVKFTILIILIAVIGISILNITDFFYKEPERKMVEGVTLTVEDGTLTRTGGTFVITDTVQPRKFWHVGYHFLEKKRFGKWKEVKYLEGVKNERKYYESLLAVGEDNKLVMKVDWSNLYGELENGEYRYVGMVSNNYINDKGFTENEDLYYYAEFTIE